MKNILFITASVFITQYIFAQSTLNHKAPDQVSINNQTNTASNKGTIIWSEDFDRERWVETVLEDHLGYVLNEETVLPEALFGGGRWLAESIGEETYHPESMNFHWSDVGPRGRYTSAYDELFNGVFAPNNTHLTSLPIGSSINNGVIMLESDYSNSREWAPDLVEEMDAYIMCGPIDLSQIQTAIFSMNTYYRYCCDTNASLALDISIDYDPSQPDEANWGTFILNNKTQQNDYTQSHTSHFNDSERNPHINISNMQIGNTTVQVAGNSAVYIRLHQSKSSHYFWIIDDLAIYEPPLYDIVLTDGFADYLYDAEDGEYAYDAYNASTNFYGGYTSIPMTVVGPFIKFRAAVVNNGQQAIEGAKAAVNITKNGENVYSEESTTGIYLEKYAHDTLKVTTDYTPDTIGSYSTTISTVLDGEDGNVENNRWKYDFKVSERYWSTVYHGDEDLYGTAGPRDYDDGGYDGDACANKFIIPENISDTKIYGIRFYFSNHRARQEELEAIEYGYFAVYGRIWSFDENLQETVETGIATSMYTINTDDTASWITIPFIDDDGRFLQAGKEYYVGLEIYTGTTQELRFMMGNDLNGPKQSAGGGYFSLAGNDSWSKTSDNYAIELILGDEAPVETKKVTFNIDTSCEDPVIPFDPEKDTIFVSGNWADYPNPGSKLSTRLYKSSTPDVYSGTAHSIEINKEYEYRYYLGSGKGIPITDWITVSVEDGNTVVNDVRSCTYLEVDENIELNTLDIYPNPFKNTLTITNTENITGVTIRNIVGKTIKEISANYTTIEFTTVDLDAGIYIISVTDANNNISTQRVVKQ